MSQDSVLKVLKRKNRWMSAKQISKFLSTREGPTRVSLNNLFKFKEIQRCQKMEFSANGRRYVYYYRIGEDQ